MFFNYTTKFLVINKNIFFSQRRKGTQRKKSRSRPQIQFPNKKTQQLHIVYFYGVIDTSLQL